MGKQITFNDSDKVLIQKIQTYKEEHNISSFVEAVRQLCRAGLSKSVNLQIDVT